MTMKDSHLTGISVCVFDAYGTLFDMSALLQSCRKKLGAQVDKLAELWRRKQEEYAWLRTLMGRHADFWHVTGESLDYAMRTLGMNDVVLRAKLMEGHLAPSIFPDVRATLDSLKAAGHRLAVLSNHSPSMLTSAMYATGLNKILDAALSVESTGMFKPHPSVYQLVQDRFECPPESVAFITANSWDAAGASAFGFKTLWLNRKGETRDVLPNVPDIEVASLNDLPALLHT
jgi:2-haloacid dehalogenase